MLGVYIALGGGVGSFLRHIISSIIARNLGTHFPFGTLSVNIIGSFAMGVIIEYFSRTLPHSNELRAFLTVGLLGGFTTFSAFSLDAISMFDRGSSAMAIAYIVASVMLSIFAVFLGMSLVKFAMQ